MLTPATTESSTSSPFTMRSKASATAVRGPPFLNRLPLAEETTTGLTLFGVITVGPWAIALAAVAAMPAPAPAFTKSRRLNLWLMAPSVRRASLDHGLRELARQERNPALAPELVVLREHLLLGEPGGAEDCVDLPDALEAREARLYRKDVVLLPRLHEQRPRRDQPGDVVHLRPVQDPGHVVVDAVRERND